MVEKLVKKKKKKGQILVGKNVGKYIILEGFEAQPYRSLISPSKMHVQGVFDLTF